MQGFLSGLLIVPVLAVLVLIHEFGHFFAARAVGAKVEEFGIGIPPRIKGWTRNGVIWSINAIPFGGFVRVLGEEGDSRDPGSMNNKTAAQRAFFLVAGSAMNFLLAVVLMVFVIGFQGETATQTFITAVQPDSPAAAAGWEPGDRIISVAGVPVTENTTVREQSRSFLDRPMSVVIERGTEQLETSVTPDSARTTEEGLLGIGIGDDPAANVTLTTVTPGSPAAAAGLAAGDRIVSVDGISAFGWQTIAGSLRRAAGGDATVVVNRAGADQTLTLAVPTSTTGELDLAALGLEPRIEVIYTAVPPLEIIPRAFAETWGVIIALFEGLGELISGRASFGDLAGPIGMAQLTSQIVTESTAPIWFTVANLSIFLSLNLAILNLLPFPALDGGRLLLILIEVIRGGKKLPPERENLINLFGFAILIGVMFVIAFMDIGRLTGGGSLLP